MTILLRLHRNHPLSAPVLFVLVFRPIVVGQGYSPL